MVKTSKIYQRLPNGMVNLTAKRPQVKPFPPIPCKEIISDPLAFFGKLPKRQLQVINSFLVLGNYFNEIYASQSYLGKRSRYSRVHSNRVISGLKDMGIISSTYRFKKTCVYSVSLFFNDFFVRAKLRHLLPALAFLPLSILMAAPNQVSAQNVTQKNRGFTKSETETRTISTMITKRDGFARVVCHLETDQDKKPKEVVMKNAPLRERVAQKLDLDIYAMKRLQDYPDSVIEVALRTVNNSKNAKNPAGLFFSACKQALAMFNKPSDSKEPDSVSVPDKKTDYVSSWKNTSVAELEHMDNKAMDLAKVTPHAGNFLLGLKQRALENAMSDNPPQSEREFSHQDFKARKEAQSRYLDEIYASRQQPEQKAADKWKKLF